MSKLELYPSDEKILAVLRTATAPMPARDIWRASRAGSRMSVVARLTRLVRYKRAAVVDEYARMKGGDMLYTIGERGLGQAAVK
jgi:hypothetical protein